MNLELQFLDLLMFYQLARHNNIAARLIWILDSLRSQQTIQNNTKKAQEEMH